MNIFASVKLPVKINFAADSAIIQVLEPQDIPPVAQHFADSEGFLDEMGFLTAEEVEMTPTFLRKSS